ncbi:MAG TPA: hypothetical protein ENN96_00225, partial [Candidatus Acetothermia bacterium]|nr:hypothetical protein [Candidatus Acetothermia bacterium]
MKRLTLLFLLLSVAALPLLGQAQLRVGIDRDYADDWEALRAAFEAASSTPFTLVAYPRSSIAQQIVLQSFSSRDPIHFFMVPSGLASVLSSYLDDLTPLRSQLAQRGVELVEVNRRPIGVAIPFAPDWMLGATSLPSDTAAAVDLLAFVATYGSTGSAADPSAGPTSVAAFATQKIAQSEHNPRVDGSLTALASAAETALASVSTQALPSLPSAARSALDALAGLFGIPFSSGTATVTVVLEAVPGRTASTVSALGLLGVQQSTVSEASGLIKVTIPLGDLGALAQQISGVSFIRPPYKPFVLGTPTQGVGLVGADAFHATGYRGAGTKIAVIDLGFSGLSQAQARGDLPYSAITNDLTGTGISTGLSHGTAVAEII